MACACCCGIFWYAGCRDSLEYPLTGAAGVSAYHSDKSLGYICRGDAAYSVELHDDTLLAGDASDTSLDASEVAIGDDDPVTILEMALRAVHKEDVIAVNARQTDKIIHLFVANDKWWILTVSIGFKVVIVVAEIGIVR